MKDTILKKLNEIERTENVKILLAVESGSRAWGFASQDSDYDVRFIYVRPKNEYLRLDRVRDVIEYQIDDVLDINGWDLDKALKLLYKSNPTLFEWFSSPIIYKETPFADGFRSVMRGYFSSKRGLSHYLSMARNNYRQYLRGDTVKAKKYFYVLRPVLACQWILDHGTPPPMLFSELMVAELAADIRPEVERLLELKTNSPEVKVIPKIESLNRYLDMSIEDVQERIRKLQDDTPRDWETLNRLFLLQLS